MPSRVTMTFFLRPLKYRLPSASSSPMSPVRIPALFVQHRLQLLALPVSGRDVGAAHQDFAVSSSFISRPSSTLPIDRLPVRKG